MPNAKSVSSSNNNQNNTHPSAYDSWIAQRDSFNNLVRQNNKDINRAFEDLNRLMDEMSTRCQEYTIQLNRPFDDSDDD